MRRKRGVKRVRREREGGEREMKKVTRRPRNLGDT